MTAAFALRLRPIRLRSAAALASALALLVACGGEPPAADGFKPVPVNPVLGDVPMGSDAAPITLLEYASFTCGHCRDFWKQDFPRLKTNYIDTGKVKFIYRDYPLDNNLAVTLAAISRCKGQDAYFAVIDDMFTSQFDILDAAQKGAAGPLLLSIAARHGMNDAEVRTCIDHHKDLKDVILKSRDEGTARGVSSTPTVFLNDERVEDHSYAALSALIDKKLNPGAATETPAAPGPATPAPAPGQ